jgi:hypothetical protein
MILFTYLCSKICLLLNTPAPVGTILRCRRNSRRFERGYLKKNSWIELCMVDNGFVGRQYQKTTLASNPKRDYHLTRAWNRYLKLCSSKYVYVLLIRPMILLAGMSLEAGNPRKSPGTLAVTTGYFFSLKKIMRENLVSAIQRTVCVSTDQHVYVCRSLQINIATYPLTRIISIVIFRSSEMKS